MSNKIIENNINETDSTIISEEIDARNPQNTDNPNISDNTNTSPIENLTSSDISLSNNTAFNQDELKYDDAPEPNCLALTVKKDYNLTVVKNVFSTAGRLTWKIALVTAIVNILNMLF